MAVAPAAGVLPGQLSALPLFAGERGEAFVNWLEVIQNAEATYGWTDANVLSVVRSKGGPKIAEWIRAKRFMGHEFTSLRDGNRPMRTPLYERFGPKYAASTAVLAVTNLKQRSTETCADFMDWCVLAVDKTYYAVPAAVKNRDGFPAVFAASILSHFGAGLKPEIAKVVLSAAAPPNTPTAMLTAAETVEAEQSKKTTPGASALAVEEYQEDKPTEDEGKRATPLLDKVEELVAAVNRLHPRGREGRGRGGQAKFDIRTVMCYNCRKRGHFQRNCPEPQMGPRYSRGLGGLFLRGTFTSSDNTSRGTMRAPFGRDRAMFHVEEEDPEDNFRCHNDQWAEDPESGNY